MSKLEDPKIKTAIRLLKAKGVTLKQIEDVYRHYDDLKWRTNNKESFLDAINQ